MLRIGLAQINTTVGDIEGNVRRGCEMMERAREMGVDRVASPDPAIPGSPPEDLLLKPDFVRANHTALERVEAHTRGLTAIVGVVDGADRLYNAAAGFVDGTRAGAHPKTR